MSNNSYQQKLEEMDNKLTGKREWLVVIGIVVLALLLRLWSLSTRSLWVDELKLFEKINEGINLSLFIEPYFNPPLIYFIIKLWMNVSQDEIVLRILPAVVGALTVLPLYGWGRRLLGATVGALGAFLFAISAFHVFYSQEINTYAFATFLAVLSTYFFVRLVQDDQGLWIWISYILTMLLGLYTHTYLAFLLFVHVVALLFIWREQFKDWRQWLFTYVVIGVIYIPRILALFGALAPGGDVNKWTELISPRLLTVRTSITAVAAMLYSYVLGMTVEPLLRFIPLIILALLVAIVSLLLTWRSQHRRAVIFLWLIFVLPMVVAILISMTVTPIYSGETPRYTLFFLPAFLLLVAQGLLLVRPVWRWIGLAIIVITSVLGLYNYYYRWEAVGMGDFKAIAQYMNDVGPAGGAVVHTTNPSPVPTRKVSTSSRRSINHYLGDNWESYVVLDEDGWEEVAPTVTDYDQLWIAFFNDTSMSQVALKELGRFTPTLSLPDWTQELTDAGYQQTGIREFPGRKYVAIYLFEKEQP